MKSIRLKLGILLAVFLLLIVGIVGATFWTTSVQKSDGLVINLAGRQRMLSQKMSKEVLEITRDLTSKELRERLASTAEEFDRVLEGLIRGDKELGLPPTTQEDILDQLQVVKTLWEDFHRNILAVSEEGEDFAHAISFINGNNLRLLAEMDKVVSMYEETSADSSVINIAGRERMLSQKMSKEALEVFNDPDNTGLRKQLLATTGEFDKSLKGLIDGDKELGLPPTSQSDILEQLRVVGLLWDEFYRNVLVLSEGGVGLSRAISFVRERNLGLLAEMNKVVGMYEGESMKKVGNLQRVQIISIVIAVVVTLISWIFIGRSIVNPIKRVVDVAQDMAEGDLTRVVEIRSKDEIGALGETFNKMVLNLRNMVENIMGTSDRVASSAAQISASSAQVSKGAELQASAVEQASSSIAQMSASIASVADDAQSLASNVAETTASIEEMTASTNQVSSSTDQLASGVNQVSSSIEEMSASIEQFAKNIKEVSQTANEAATEANDGREAVEQVIEGMADVRERMEELAGVIGRLDQSSREIGTIIEVIDDIAEQTNLLALNAAIESARAGEAGRGFAVVADEVRKLAERSSKATKEIADLIKGIQRETASAVESANSSREIVQKGAELSDRAGGALRRISESSVGAARLMDEMAIATEEQTETSKQIVKAVEDMNSLTQQIANALREQALGSEEINKAVLEMSKRTEQVSGATQEQQRTGEQVVKATETISSAAEENRAAVVEMSKSAEDLAKQAEGLKDLISALKIGEDRGGKEKDRTEIALVGESTGAEDVIS